MSNDVGDLGTQRSIDRTRECSKTDRSQKDIGESESFTDEEGFGVEDGLDGGQSLHGFVDKVLVALRVEFCKW